MAKTLEINVKADVSQAIKGFKTLIKVTRQLNKELKIFELNLDNLGKQGLDLPLNITGTVV